MTDGTQPRRWLHWSRRSQRLLATFAVFMAVATLSVAWTDSAHAAPPRIYEFTVTPSTTQAGGHPDLVTQFWVANPSNYTFPEPSCECQDPRNTTIDFPAGVIGDAHGLPQCTDQDFGNNECPIDSQVGLVDVQFNAGAPPLPPSIFPAPVYNLVPHGGQAGLLGFPAPLINSPVYMVISSRTESDYGLSIRVADITHILGIGLSVIKVTIFGVPADPSNDYRRLGPRGCDARGSGSPPPPTCTTGFPSNSPIKPFLSNPTTCGVPLSASLEVTWYDLFTESAGTPFPATTGCDQLSFNPSLFGQPTTTETDAASGFEVNLDVPQGESPTVPSGSSIRATDVSLPEGFSINANAADGKTVCTDAEANFGIRELAGQCPEHAKIGTLSISSSALPGPLSGFVYLGEPKSGDRYRLILVADGFGLHVKLPGSIFPDPRTGRVRVSFPALPQFPFSNFNMHIFGSERGLLATPTHCGTYAVDSTFTPWDGQLAEQSSSQFFNLDSGPAGRPCPPGTRPFDPTFAAGVSDRTAGKHAPFALELDRPDGDQNLSSLTISAPPGLLAKLKGVPYCPEEAIAEIADSSYSGLREQASSACPPTSRIGTVTAAAGAGSRPVYVSGRVYLAGPYKGAPLSLVAAIPAVSGPYDLGNVVVRAAISVDPVTARVTALSDSLPQIVGGIPLRLRSILVELDRPGFMLNPTNCDPFSIDAMALGVEGASAQMSESFQVANCVDLPYRPKLSLRLSGGVKRRGHPAIHAVFTTRPGEANTRRVSVTLPKGQLLDNAHIETICTRVQFARDSCPAGSRIGTAQATTPLLDQPLQGAVYLRSSSNRLPDMAIDLRGQINIQLVARIDSVDGRLRTTIESAPDAPVSSVDLDLAGGKKGLLINSENLCGAHKKAKVRMTGQNGRIVSQGVSIKPSCGKAAHRTSRKAQNRRLLQERQG